MGNRANMVVVENGDWTVHYAHWAGCRMLDAVAFGPEHAVRYVRAHKPEPELGYNGWTDPLWADGGVVVDLDRSRMLFFGEELAASMNERRAMLDVLPLMWPGYEVGWAYGGTDELVDYLGAGRRWELGRRGAESELAGARSGLCHLVSVVDANGTLRMWPLKWGYSAAWLGPTMIDTLPGRGVSRMRRDKIPESGVHVDVGNKSVGVWTTWEARGIFDLLPERWPGWRTDCWDDRYEEQLLRCGGALRIPELDLAAGVEEVRNLLHKRVFQSFSDSPAGAIVNIAGMFADAGLPAPTISKSAVTGSPFRPTKDDWNRFADACCAQRLLYTKGA
jgi:hypothetical protein